MSIYYEITYLSDCKTVNTKAESVVEENYIDGNCRKVRDHYEKLYCQNDEGILKYRDNKCSENYLWVE